MRWILNALYLDFLLLAAPYWLWKAPQGRRYRSGLLERLGFVKRRRGERRCLWVHAASVGEASVPRSLVEVFRKAHPDWEVVFSTVTDTGADRLRSLYPDCRVFYWPLDLSWCVARSLDRIRPSAVALVELEVWPNFLLSCLDRRIPAAIVSGRINRPSARFLRGLTRLCPQMWEAVRLCCARSARDAELFVHAGLPRGRIFTTGSLKYDALPLQADTAERERLRAELGLAPDGSVLVAGSTHPGENEVLCDVYRKLRREHDGLRLILVPRHVELASQTARSVRSMGLPVARKSELGPAPPSQDDVIVIDTIGELITCYSLATCVFVGKSLLPPGGGQNMMEPAALGKPVVVGPHTGNFQPEMELLARREGVAIVRGREGLLGEVERLLNDPGAAGTLGKNARDAVLESRGATDRTLARLEGALDELGLLWAGRKTT